MYKVDPSSLNKVSTKHTFDPDLITAMAAADLMIADATTNGIATFTILVERNGQEQAADLCVEKRVSGTGTTFIWSLNANCISKDDAVALIVAHGKLRNKS